MNPLAVLAWIAGIGLAGAILLGFRDVLIPIAVAILVWQLINALARGFGRIGFGWFDVPGWLSYCLAIAAIVIAFAIIFQIMASNVVQLSTAAADYQATLEVLVDRIIAYTGVEQPPTLSQLVEEIDLRGLIASLTAALGTLASNVGLIALYVIFLLLEQGTFQRKMDALFPQPARAAEMRSLLEAMQTRISTYLRIKTLVSLLTGTLTFAVLWLFGVDYAGFWGLMVFLFNFIPFLGAAVAVLFPAVLTLVQFGSISLFAIVSAILIVIQFIVGNLIEPRLMGNSLNLSPVVILLSLALWGSVWGIAGMLICVPITVIAMIVCAHFHASRPIAVLLSANGRID